MTVIRGAAELLSALSSRTVAVNEREPTTRRERLAFGPTIRATSCIPAGELAAMRRHALPEERRTVIAEHLEGCATCREFFTRIEQSQSDPDHIGRYLIKRRLGAGGMGVVYEAMDPNLDRRVAIKVVRPEQLDDDARRRLLREARALAKISHPNVVTVHDVGEHGDQVFVATEFVDGETMATWQVGRDWRALVGAWIQVAHGLSAAHAGGIVHRDVKPQNVFVGRDGRVRVGDFGIARGQASEVAESSSGPVVGIGQLTVTGVTAGTPGYMAPEQLRGAVDARSDQFALCVSVIEGLTGKRPEAGAAPPLPQLPAALRDALLRGLSVAPAARFTTMIELAGALAAAVDAAAAPPRRGRPWIPITLAVTVVVVTAAMVVAVAPRPGKAVNRQAYEASRKEQQAPNTPVLSTRTGDVVASTGPAPATRGSDAAGPDGEASQRGVDSRSEPSPAAGSLGSGSGGHNRPRPIAPKPRAPQKLDEASARELLKQARVLDANGDYDEARLLYQRLENAKEFRSEALYRGAWAAFQSNDVDDAARLALQGASEPGTFQLQAKFLYGDALYRQGAFKHAKEYYLALRRMVRGDDRATAAKTIAACNKALNLPDTDGIHD
jgi:serine/threonine protein kinase